METVNTANFETSSSFILKNSIASQLKNEAEKVLPSLLRFADKKDYIYDTQEKMQSINFEKR